MKNCIVTIVCGALLSSSAFADNFGALTVENSAQIGKNLQVGISGTTFTGGNIIANKSTSTGLLGNITADGSLEATNGTVTAGGNITSNTGRILANTFLQAGSYVQATTYTQSPIFKTPGTTTTGTLSVALGTGTTATTYGAVVIGRNNLEKQKDGTTIPPPGSASAWNDNDPLFVVGNGKGAADPVPADRYRNAFTVYKDGTIRMSKRQGDIVMGSFGNGGTD